jgi:hypothetical protein
METALELTSRGGQVGVFAGLSLAGTAVGGFGSRVDDTAGRGKLEGRTAEMI